MLPNIPKYTGQPPKQRLIWPTMSLVLGLRQSGVDIPFIANSVRLKKIMVIAEADSKFFLYKFQ